MDGHGREASGINPTICEGIICIICIICICTQGQGHGHWTRVPPTCNPSLFAFSDILSLPTVSQLQGTEHSIYLDLLRLFAHGTWTHYNSKAGSLLPLVPDQVLKLKQLTVLTLAETSKVLPYDQLLEELDFSNVRELEDFLINECIYAAGMDFPGHEGIYSESGGVMDFEEDRVRPKRRWQPLL